MANDGYRPLLSDLLDLSIIPGDLQEAEQSVEDFLTDVLGNVRYSDHLVFHSHQNDAKLHTLMISVPKKSLGVDRSKMRFVVTAADGIPCTFRWHWSIMRYAPLFNWMKPVSSALAVFDAAMDFINLSVDRDDAMELLEKILEALCGEEIDLGDVTDFDSFYAAIEQPFAFGTQTAMVTVLPPLWEAFQEDPNEVWPLARELFEGRVGSLTLEDAIDILEDIFLDRMGLTNWSEFNDLLLPYIRMSARDVSLGVEFPQSWLTPVNENDELVIGEHAILDFTVGDVVYDTRTGISFDDALQGDLKRSMIGKTGLILTITAAKLDYSRTESIPEIATAGYPHSFRGVFIKLARVELPPKWFHPKIPVSGTIPSAPSPGTETSQMSLAITAEDVVIGTGKISGDLKLQQIKTVRKAP